MKEINIMELAAKCGIVDLYTTHSNNILDRKLFESYSKELCRLVLELAAENAEVEIVEFKEVSEEYYNIQYDTKTKCVDYYDTDGVFCGAELFRINKQTIMNVINQVK